MKISDSLDVHALSTLQLQAFYALDRLTEGAADRFSATAIADHLVEVCGVSTSRQAVSYALQQEKGMCNKNGDGYKLMQPGREKLSSTLSSGVIYIESGKPFSAKNIELKKILSALKGTVYISDPYLDVHTLDIIFKSLDKSLPIKILTSSIGDKPTGSFARHLGELRQEGFKIEIGVYSSSDLHDRYIMDDASFWHSGNSLNHLGNKESFLIRLGEDIRQSMITTFNGRWKVAIKI